MKQKLIYLALIIAKLVRELVYLFIGLTIFGILEDGGFGIADSTQRAYFIIFIIAVVILIFASYLLPFLFRKKWPKQVAYAEQSLNKPHKAFIWLAVVIVVVAIIALFVSMQSVGVL